MMELFSKLAVPLVVAAVLVIAVLLLGNLGIHQVRSMIADAVAAKADERDAFWSAKIEKANADADKRTAATTVAVLQIQTETADQIRADQAKLSDLKVKNAKLDNASSCGLSGDRVGLLPD